jgi:predicted Rossmann-fold nucleotide-binding protein
MGTVGAWLHRSTLPTVELRDLSGMLRDLERVLNDTNLPYYPQRASLYSVDELLVGYQPGRIDTLRNHSTDARIYHHYVPTKHQPTRVESLLQRLHDHAIDEALRAYVSSVGTRVVAFMGGHALLRDDPLYLLVARCAQRLSRAGYLVATGGGPGAMEAANLGAFAANEHDSVIVELVKDLSKAPHYNDDNYIPLGLRVRAELPEPTTRSLGIPTWFYGHEPSNVFCTSVAKYFNNALREEALCAVARHGIVFAPGGPGTLQEVFMDLCQNAYATYGEVSPMVFLSSSFWCDKAPVYPLLQKLGQGKAWLNHVACVDAIEDVVTFIANHPPLPAKK